MYQIKQKPENYFDFLKRIYGLDENDCSTKKNN